MGFGTASEDAAHRPTGVLLPRLALATLVVATTYVGWRAFWFLTDDSMIAFRYVSNSMAGRGLVWNPAPFQPVEGYTSFLWCVLLEWTWLLTGVEPPQASNWLSLGFGYGTLWVGYLFFRRSMRHVRDTRHWNIALVSVALLTLTNRTFLAWLSSGLETSLFNFCLTWWLYEALTPAHARSSRWLLRLSSAATAIALVRPDGMLFVAAALSFVLLHFHSRRFPPGNWTDVLQCAPLMLIGIHFLWRKSFYGNWLPNTFYAKYIGLTPDRGADFLVSFIVEYGMWWPLLVAIFALYRHWQASGAFRWDMRWIPITTLAFHVAFYTLVMGGDHFEYRVLSYLPLLVTLALTWLIFTHVQGRSPRLRVPMMALLVYALVSLPIPWAHWLETRGETEYTGPLFRPIAHRFPAGVRTAVAWWDGLQDTLIEQASCVRHQEHKTYFEHRSSFFPPREVGQTIPWDARPVHVTGSVGIVGWVLPNVAIIDYLGLNDRVIARTPPTHPDQMAHAHRPPEGYVDCFDPNVYTENRVLAVEQRVTPLTDARILECESRDWSRVAPNLDAELRRTRERRKRMYEIILDDQSRQPEPQDP